MAHSEERLGQGLRTGADWSVGPQRREPGATPTVTVPVRPTASAMSVVLIVLIVLIVLVVLPGRLPRGRRCALRHYILQVVESCSLYAVLNEIGTADIPGWSAVRPDGLHGHSRAAVPMSSTSARRVP